MRKEHQKIQKTCILSGLLVFLSGTLCLNAPPPNSDSEGTGAFFGFSSFRVGKEILTADDKTLFSRPFVVLTQDRQEQP